MAGAAELTSPWNWTLCAAAGGGIALVAVAGWIRTTRYRLSRHEFEILIVGIVFRRVFLHEIEDVFVGTRFPCEFWPSGWIFRGRYLTIRRKRGLLRNLAITPRDPDQLRRNLYYALGWKP